MKDHELAEFINDLRDIAIKYAGTQQLRQRIATRVKQARGLQCNGRCKELEQELQDVWQTIEENEDN